MVPVLKLQRVVLIIHIRTQEEPYNMLHEITEGDTFTSSTEITVFTAKVPTSLA